MKTNKIMKACAYTVFALLITLFSINSAFAQAEIDPDHFVFDTFEDVQPMTTTITWNGATDVMGIYLDLGSEIVDFMWDITNDDGTNATLTIIPPAKSTNTIKGESAILNCVIDFDIGPSVGFIIEVLNPDWIVDIFVYDQDTYVGIYNAAIYFHELEETYYTDHGGYLEIELDEGFYTLDINASGYFPLENYVIEIIHEVNEMYLEIPLEKDLFDFLMVLGSYPEQHQTEVDVYQSIIIHFDRNIQEGIVGYGFAEITFKDEFDHDWGISEIHIDQNSLIIFPFLPMDENTTYFLTVPVGSVADAGNIELSLEEDFILAFTTEGGPYYDEPYIYPSDQMYAVLEPENVLFNIYWGEEEFINEISLFEWDYENEEYITLPLEYGTDYDIMGNELVIFNNFIESLNPTPGDYFDFYVEFGSGWPEYISIYVLYTTKPYITPDFVYYDLSNPGDAFTNIAYAIATSVTDVSVSGNSLDVGIDFDINDNWFIVYDSFLATEIPNVGDEVIVDVTFDTMDEAQLTIQTIESGITNATIDPSEFLVSNNDLPEYIETTVTWNDASEIEQIMVSFVEGGSIYEFEFEAYELFPIDSETATLRIYFEEGGKSKFSSTHKNIDYQYISLHIHFDTGAPAILLLTMTYEYYEVIANVVPEYSGYVWGAWEQAYNSEVEIEAVPHHEGFVFEKFVFDGGVEVTENPYTFTMPANNVYVTAYFTTAQILPEYQLFSLSEPEDLIYDIIWQNETFINEIGAYVDGIGDVNLNPDIDYTIIGDELIIGEDFITQFDLEHGDEISYYAIFGSGVYVNFQTKIVFSTKPIINPAELTYDLSNPTDLFTFVFYNQANEIVGIYHDGNELSYEDDYYTNVSWLYFKNDFLASNLSDVSDIANLEVHFDTGDVITVNINTVETGITNATIDPAFGSYSVTDMPEYIETVITWNDASEVVGIHITVAEEDGLMEFEEEEYEVIEIDEATSLLKIPVGGGGKSIEYISVSMEIMFDVGGPAYYHLSIGINWFSIYVDVQPNYGGWIDGPGGAFPGDMVELIPHPNYGFEFLNWQKNGVTISDDNPYVFEMPEDNVYLTANFINEGAEVYSLTLFAEPENAGTALGSGNFAEGQYISIEAEANEGYIFEKWTTDGEEIFSELSFYSFHMMSQNMELTAHFVEDDSNIETHTAFDFNTYPNPFNEFIRIESRDNIDRIVIIQITGQIVMDIKNNSSNVEINTSDLPAGFYIMKIHSSKGEVGINKLIKQ